VVAVVGTHVWYGDVPGTTGATVGGKRLAGRFDVWRYE